MGSGGGIPNPRKLIEASPKINPPILIDDSTITFTGRLIHNETGAGIASQTIYIYDEDGAIIETWHCGKVKLEEEELEEINNQESEEKNKVVDRSVVDQTSDKLLPWEDILPPKTKS